MSLRLKLLLVALSTLVLPWAGWRFVREVEGQLRQGQEQAQLTSAGMLAKLIALRHVALPAAQAVFHVVRSRQAIVIDGYADDWAPLRDYAQAVGLADDPHKLEVTLARDSGAGLCILASVRDATRTRADPADPRMSISDHVSLVLTQGGETRRYALGGAAPGTFEARAEGPGALLPERMSGAYQEDGSGYRVELRLPANIAPERIGIGVYDAAAPATDAPDPRPLVGIDDATSAALAALVPARARARLVSADGWLIAAAGTLDASSPAGDGDAAADSSWLGNLVYQNLIAPALGGSVTLDASAPRIAAPEVWQALSGVDATSWRPAHQHGAVVLTAAIPIRERADLRGALVLEQVNRALPLLANRAVIELAAATLAALLVAALLLLIFGVSLSLRIGKLRDAAERAVRTSGRLEGPLPLADARDELGDLARSFGKLLDEVAANTDYLSTLASKLSHELNTPLAIVKSSLDNLDHHELDAVARLYLGRARNGADRLGAVMRAMSEATRVEQAIAAAEAEDFDLRALISDCAESYRVLAAPRVLRLDLPGVAVPFHGAPELIAQALDKLFENACSFAPPNGYIALSLVQSEAIPVTIRFANTGPLLPEMMQDRLFDMLVSVRSSSNGRRYSPAAPDDQTVAEAMLTVAETSLRTEVPHLGLGLNIVRLVVELHRGCATARNFTDGSGVEVLLELRGMPRLPLARYE